MIIRPITAVDAPEWMRMRMLLWPDGTGDHALEIEEYFASPPAWTIVLVADRGDGRLGGFLEARTRSFAEGCTTSPVGYVEGWWVDEDLRRSGVGAQLVAAAENWARTHNLTEMASDCSIDNEPGQTAHASLGYHEVARTVCFRKGL